MIAGEDEGGGGDLLELVGVDVHAARHTLRQQEARPLVGVIGKEIEAIRKDSLRRSSSSELPTTRRDSSSGKESGIGWPPVRAYYIRADSGGKKRKRPNQPLSCRALVHWSEPSAEPLYRYDGMISRGRWNALAGGIRDTP
jgi:hypothetical protein